MAKIKFDFKQFVMQKGERVGLGVALGLMALLFLWGIIGAISARSPAQEIAKAADNLNQRVNTVDSSVGPDKDFKVPEMKEWVQGVNPDWLRPVPFFEPNAAGNAKRTMPVVLPVDFKLVDGYPVLVGQYDVVFLGGKAFEIVNRTVASLIPKGGKTGGVGFGKGMPNSPPGGKGGQGGPGGFGGFPGSMKGSATASDKKYKEIMVPVHALVVSATYPVKEQLEQIRKALRYNSVKEMFESGGADASPEFGGLAVLRRELGADGKPGEWLAMKLDDPNGPTITLYEKLKGFEPEDEEQLKHIFPGLVMPRPYSLTADYPLIKLGKEIPEGSKKEDRDKVAGKATQPGILAPGPGGMAGPGGAAGGKSGFGGMGFPGAGQGGRVEYQPEYQAFDKLPKEYEGPDAATQAKFEGKFDLFEPGGFPREEGDKAVTGGIVGGNKGAPGGVDASKYGKMMGMGKQQPKGPESRVAGMSLDKMPDKGLVRFVDVTVKPGHTYQYMVKARLRNPNFKKKSHEVASSDLARKEFVDSPWVWTEPVRVGLEIHFYNVDQRLVETPQNFYKKHMRGTDTDGIGKDRVAVQIHRFLGDIKDTAGYPRQVSDWAIAERVLVPRGEYIGKEIEVEMPAWEFDQEEFELIRDKAKRGTRGVGGSVAVDFSTRKDLAKTLVVDFRGGALGYPVDNKASTADEAATELLILGPDGKLSVRNSRTDLDKENNPAAVERAERLYHLRERIHELKQPRQQTAPLGGGGRGS